MDSELLAWTRRPRRGGSVRFATRDGWDRWPYDRLATLVRRTSCALVAAGVRRGDVVAVAQDNGPQFVAAFFGALLAGATPGPLAPRAAFADGDRYDRHADRILRQERPVLLLHGPSTGRAAELAAARGITALAADRLVQLVGDADREPGRRPADVALVQFTSGTAGPSRGVRIGADALTANLRAIAGWLRMTPADPTASWLPVHHDMGLVGCLLAPVTVGADLWSMPTVEFLRNPVRYLECFGRHGARLTAMPAFGLDYITRRVPPARLAGMDFTDWRAVIVGAERIAPATLRRFISMLQPFGLRPEALLPAYGLAEATLAVTGLPLHRGWREVTGRGEGAVVGCGVPLAGVTVAVHDPSGEPVGDGQVGEIVVGGASVARSYLDADSSAIRNGRVHTGDAGFLHDGELHVVGRLGDGVKVRGRFVFAADVEAALVGAADVPVGRVAALAGVRGGRPTVVVVVERPEPRWLQAAAAAGVGEFDDDVEVVVVAAPAGAIERTSSGKPRRRAMWRAFLDGRLRGAQRDVPASPRVSSASTASCWPTR